mgnify:FL=1
MSENYLPPATVGFLAPDRIVANFGLKAGDNAADFGDGHGYFSIPLARSVGPEGKVYAIDIQRPVLDTIRSHAKTQHLLNMEYVWGDLDDPGGSRLPDRFIDFVLVGNILFQVEHKEVMLGEAWRILREGGRLALVEWEHSRDRLGPPLEARVKKETARSLAIQAGFEFDREFSASPRHYGLLFYKP